MDSKPSKFARDGKTQLKIWIDKDERAELDRLAEKAGLSITDYIRAQCIKAPPRRKRRGADVEALVKVNARLGNLGGLINQLARVANENGELPTLTTLGHIREHIHAAAADVARATGYDPQG